MLIVSSSLVSSIEPAVEGSDLAGPSCKVSTHMRVWKISASVDFVPALFHGYQHAGSTAGLDPVTSRLGVEITNAFR